MKGLGLRLNRLVCGFLCILMISIWFGTKLQVNGASMPDTKVTETVSQDSKEHKLHVWNATQRHINDESLTKAEVEYITSLNVLSVGVPENNIPLSYLEEETNELKGITVDMIKAIGNDLGMKFQFLPYDVSVPLDELVDSGQFDLIVPIGGQHNYETTAIVRKTDCIFQGSIVLVKLQDFEYEKPNFTIGLIKEEEEYQEYILDKYPELNIIQYEDHNDALLALKRGEVKALAENINVLDYLMQSPIYSELKIMPGVLIGLDYCILQPAGGNVKLYDVLNKGIRMLSEQEKASIVYQYRGNNIYTYKFQDYVYLYRWVILAVVIISCFLAIIAFQRKKNCSTMKEINQELIEANKSKNKFLSNVSHEIRTPMNAIIGLTSICANNLDNKEVLKQNLEKIDMSAHFLLSLINDILDISRIESGKIVLNEEVVAFDEFILQINTMIGERVENKGVHYECIVGDTVAAYYIFDRLKLQQVIINILSNAIKFTPSNGKVRIRIEQEEMIADKALLAICIADTGVGIEEAFLPKIFDAFTQEYSDNTTTYTGSGLGLAISKNIVNLLNGNIEVISNKGQGATFIVKVLVGVAKEYHKIMKQTPKEEIQFDFVNKRVLLVEDNEINLEVAKAILEHVGIAVECVENGKEAVDRFNDAPVAYYDAILMDIRMPVMDGLDAARTIRKLDKEEAKRIPIIAMTANAFEEDIRKSIKAGMNCHMTKPIEPKILYETLAKVMRK